MEKQWNRLADQMVEHQIITEENREVVIYGLDMIAFTVLSLSSLLLLGTLFGRFAVTVCWLVPVVLLQSTCGGYHAQTHTRCYATLLASWLLTAFLAPKLPVEACTLALLASFPVIWALTPLEHENAPMSPEKFQKMKRASRALLLALLAVDALLALLTSPMASAVALGIATSAVSMAATALQRGRRNGGAG